MDLNDVGLGARAIAQIRGIYILGLDCLRKNISVDLNDVGLGARLRK